MILEPGKSEFHCGSKKSVKPNVQANSVDGRCLPFLELFPADGKFLFGSKLTNGVAPWQIRLLKANICGQIRHPQSRWGGLDPAHIRTCGEAPLSAKVEIWFVLQDTKHDPQWENRRGGVWMDS
jgi:hypothetical protein